VESADGFAAPYDLVVTLEDVFICVADEFEPNNSKTAAVDVAAGVHTATVCTSSDEDWYAVELSRDDEISVTLDFVHDDGDLDLYLYGPVATSVLETCSVAYYGSLECSEREEQPCECRSIGTADREELVGIAEESGTYYVRVDAFGTTAPKNNLYTVTIEVDRNCIEDPLEGDVPSTQATPAVLDFGEELTLAHTDLQLCYDDDWYQVDIPACARLVAQVDFEHDDGNLEVELLEAATETSCENAVLDCAAGEICRGFDGTCATGTESTGTVDVEAVAYPSAFDPALKTVLLHVYVAGEQAKTNYDLTLTLTEAESGCP
jgi:hypothetical protein